MSALDSLNQHNTFGANPIPVSAGSILPQYLQPVQMHASRWPVEEAMSLANSLNGLTVLENGHLTKQDMQENVGLSHSDTCSIAIQQPITSSGIQTKAPETVMPSRIDPMVSPRVTDDALAAKTTSASQVDMRRNPISRSVRHLGPPPGFSPVPLKPANTLYVNNSSSGLTRTISFPFPGKHVPMVQFQTEKQKRWLDYNTIGHLKFQHEQKLQLQQIMNGNQQFTISLDKLLFCVRSNCSLSGLLYIHLFCVIENDSCDCTASICCQININFEVLSFCWSTDDFRFKWVLGAKQLILPFSPDLQWKIEDTIFKTWNLYRVNAFGGYLG
ncbi:hypothetical protein V6N13_113797 [Hibiscus sabdariffa]